MHAAAVVAPAGSAWLLIGPTGSGKSTLAYALSRAGWGVLGDDGVIVGDTLGGGRLFAIGWHDPVRVSIRLAGAFPELGSDNVRAQVMSGDARERTTIDISPPRPAPIAGLVWVTHGTRDAMVKRSPTEALADLVRDSAWVLIADEWARPHLAALRQLVTSVPSFALTHSAAQLTRIGDTLQSASNE